jgi:hypothetical protein
MAKAKNTFTDEQKTQIANAEAYRDKQIESFGADSPQVADANLYLEQLDVVFNGGQV